MRTSGCVLDFTAHDPFVSMFLASSVLFVLPISEHGDLESRLGLVIATAVERIARWLAQV